MGDLSEQASALFLYDKALGNKVAGCDEAGRGCFAGPLVSAAVLLDYETLENEDLQLLK